MSCSKAYTKLPLCVALSQHPHIYSAITCLSVKTMLQKTIWGLFIEFIICTFFQTSHFANSYHALGPFLPVLALAMFESSTRSALGLHMADTPPHLATDQGQLVQGSWSVGHCGSLEVCAKSHVLPTISFLLWALPHAKTQSEDWGCSIEGNISLTGD